MALRVLQTPENTSKGVQFQTKMPLHGLARVKDATEEVARITVGDK